MADLAKLFVYGTLRRGFGHPMAELLDQNASYLGKGFFQGTMFDLGPYPVVVAAPFSEHNVVGDLYFLKHPKKVLSIMDDYEGVNEVLETGVIFKRKKVYVYLMNGSKQMAWAYLHEGYTDHLAPILNGDYLEFVKKRI
ncbi:MAG: gamma-glutamylcyclotransferase family protein [Cyclobacteriaceae bacterium]